MGMKCAYETVDNIDQADITDFLTYGLNSANRQRKNHKGHLVNRYLRQSVLSILLCAVVLNAPASAAEPVPHVQTHDVLPANSQRVLPDNAGPPERLVPLHSLPPLPESEEGVIRSVRLADDRKVAALTFDLCELATRTNGYDADIIDFLRTNAIPATLFMGGKWMRTHEQPTLELMANPLFEIANHAWTHGNFGIMSAEAMQQQVFWTQAQYELLQEKLRATGRTVPQSPCLNLFRLPYGRCSDAALRLLNSAGLRVVQWDVVAESTGDNSVPGMEQRVVPHVRPGSILLFHANRVPKGSAVLLRRTVQALQKRGYTFVTVSTLLSLGEAQRKREGYFLKPGDNLNLDKQFGKDGTGK